MPTVTLFHRAVVDDPAFVGGGTGFEVYTSWIETDFANTIPPYAGGPEGAAEPSEERRSITVEVGDKRLEVVLPASLGAGFGIGDATGAAKKPRREKKRAGAARFPVTR